jgi:hypothetical protein
VQFAVIKKKEMTYSVSTLGMQKDFFEAISWYKFGENIVFLLRLLAC